MLIISAVASSGVLTDATRTLQEEEEAATEVRHIITAIGIDAYPSPCSGNPTPHRIRTRMSVGTESTRTAPSGDGSL